MGFGSVWHWLIVLLVVVLIFGTAKLPRAMSDFAKGIKAFKSGMKDDEADASSSTQQVPPAVTGTGTASATADRPLHDRG
jgi:sec-independent protein translocase protein TatA